ncbi:MAG: hypothetical protein ACO2ZP_06605 [Bacteriovoracaceae bacterium]
MRIILVMAAVIFLSRPIYADCRKIYTNEIKNFRGDSEEYIEFKANYETFQKLKKMPKIELNKTTFFRFKKQDLIKARNLINELYDQKFTPTLNKVLSGLSKSKLIFNKKQVLNYLKINNENMEFCDGKLQDFSGIVTGLYIYLGVK